MTDENTNSGDGGEVSLSVNTLGNQSAMEKAEETTQLDERRIATDVGRGILPPYKPETLAAFQELNETHQACLRKKARYEVGYGFDIVPHPQATEPNPDGQAHQAVEEFWHGSDSRWQIGPEQSAASTPEEVLELARQDYHGIGWCALEILVEGDGTPVGLAHVPATTVRVRKTTTTTTNEDGEQVEEIQSGHGYVQIRQGRRRYFGEAGDRYKDNDPVFVDRENGDTASSADKLENDPANELIFVPNPSALSLYYGIPDWVAAMQTMSADQAAKEWNHDVFDNLGIPYYAIKVTGGTLTEDSKDELRDLMDNLKGSRYRTAILEVDEFAQENDLMTEDGSDVEITLEPIGSREDLDMEFQAFRQRNEHEIAKVHEVPPVLIGVTDTSNRSNSEAQISEFAADIIAPEQAKFEARLYRILHQQALGVDDWTIDFELRGASQPQEEARTARTKIQAVRGAVPVNRALEMIGEEPLDDDHPVDGETLLANVGNDANPVAPGEQESSRPDGAPPEANKIGTRSGVTIELDDPLTPDEVRVDTMQFDSSNLRAGLYDRQTRDLYIRFKGDPLDRIYVYIDVPEDTWQGLKDASSHGSYHHDYIKWDFVYEELTSTSGWPQIGAGAPTEGATGDD